MSLKYNPLEITILEHLENNANLNGEALQAFFESISEKNSSEFNELLKTINLLEREGLVAVMGNHVNNTVVNITRNGLIALRQHRSDSKD